MQIVLDSENQTSVIWHRSLLSITRNKCLISGW